MIPLNVGIILVLLIIAYQDLKYRAVSWVWFVSGFALVVIRSLLINEVNTIIRFFGINSLFITLQFICLAIYMMIKHKKLINIFKGAIGIGDLLFFVVLSLCLSPLNFVAFYVLSLFIILIVFGVMGLLRKKKMLVPLAGMASLLFIPILLIDWIMPAINVYSDTFLVQLLLTWQ